MPSKVAKEQATLVRQSYVIAARHRLASVRVAEAASIGFGAQMDKIEEARAVYSEFWKKHFGRTDKPILTKEAAKDLAEPIKAAEDVQGISTLAHVNDSLAKALKFMKDLHEDLQKMNAGSISYSRSGDNHSWTFYSQLAQVPTSHYLAALGSIQRAPKNLDPDFVDKTPYELLEKKTTRLVDMSEDLWAEAHDAEGAVKREIRKLGGHIKDLGADLTSIGLAAPKARLTRVSNLYKTVLTTPPLDLIGHGKNPFGELHETVISVLRGFLKTRDKEIAAKLKEKFASLIKDFGDANTTLRDLATSGMGVSSKTVYQLTSEIGGFANLYKHSPIADEVRQQAERLYNLSIHLSSSVVQVGRMQMVTQFVQHASELQALVEDKMKAG
jgi:hypothetical protein